MTRRHEVVTTRGGARAVRSLEAGEIMHPGVGPLVEAEALYVRQSRLVERLATCETLVVFDVGLGAGSNALAARAAAEAAPSGGRLELVSFERDLDALALALEEGAAFGMIGEAAAAAQTLLATGRHTSARTSWRLVPGELPDALAAARVPADVVFWDPYSPRANPGLWTIAAFSALRACAGPACTLFTYSASTATRVALLLAGWAVGAGDGTGSKAETTAAAVRLADVARPLPRSWLGRLAHRDAPLPADAPPDVVARVRAAAQFA